MGWCEVWGWAGVRRCGGGWCEEVWGWAGVRCGGGLV